MIGSRGMTSVLEKAGCEHIKTIVKTDSDMAVEEIKTLLEDVLNVVKRFFFEVWNKGGQQLAALEAKVYTKKVRP